MTHLTQLSPRYSLRTAALRAGVSRYTLRRWLVALGYAVPAVARGSRLRLSEELVAEALAAHSLQRRRHVEAHQ